MKVTLTNEAQCELDDLAPSIQERVLSLVERLEKWPEVSGVKALAGRWKSHSLLRTGDYRVIFTVDADKISIVRIGHRREVYN